MSLATQASLRQRTYLYIILLGIMHFILLLYVRNAAMQLVNYVFQKEMLARAAYTTALAEWSSANNLVSGTVLGGISDDAPFFVGLKEREAALQDPADAAMAEAVIAQGMGLSSGFPATAHQWSEALDGIVTVEETEVTPSCTGIAQDFFAIIVCLVAVETLVILCTMTLANWLAANRAAGGRQWVAGGLVVSGYVLLPAAMTVGVLWCLTLVQHAAVQNAAEVDLRRSAELYAATYVAMATIVAAADATLLGSTLNQVNDRFWPHPSLYQAILVVGGGGSVGSSDVSSSSGGSDDMDGEQMEEVNWNARHFSTPIYSREVRNAIFGSDAESVVKTSRRQMNFIGHVGPYAFAAKPLEVITGLLLVIRLDGNRPRITDAQYLPGLVSLLAVTFGMGLVFLVVAFPFAALGTAMAPTPPGVSPWASRLPVSWPYWKLLEATVVVVITLVVVILSVSRINSHFLRIAALKAYYENRNSILESIQLVSSDLADCYVDTLLHDQWSTAYVTDSGTQLSQQEMTSLVVFYLKLSELLQGQVYYVYSLGVYLTAQDQSRWPLLSNLGYTSSIANGPQTNYNVVLMQHWITRYDEAVLLAIICNNISVLENGDDAVEAGILMFLLSLPPNSGVDITEPELVEALDLLTDALEPYAQMARALEAQTINRTSFEELYASDLGVFATKIETSIAQNEINQLPVSINFDLSYPFYLFSGYYACYVLLAVALLVLIWDTVYTPLVYAGVKWQWLRRTANASGREGLVVQVKTNDHTAPHGWATVDMHSLRTAVQQLIGCYVVLVLFSSVMAAVCQNRATENAHWLTNEANYYQKSLVPLSERLGSAVEIGIGLAAWSRAFLSLQNKDVALAVSSTVPWTSMVPINWTGGTADHDAMRIASTITRNLLSTVLNISTQTALLFLENDVEKVYRDMCAMLKQYDHYLHFDGYATCTSYIVQSWESNSFGFLSCIVENAGAECFNTYTAPLLAYANMCRGRGLPEDFEQYLYRVQALRMRSTLLINHVEVAEMVGAIAGKVAEQVDLMFDTCQLRMGELETVSSLLLPWLTMLYVWLACPFLVLIFRNASKLHQAIYSS